MESKKKKNRKKIIKSELPFYKKLSTYLYIFGTFLLIFLSYIFYIISISERKLFTLSFIPLFLGIIYENKRLSTDWKIITLKAIGAFILSFFVFLPGKSEKNYDLENHIEMWPFTFLGIFVFISVMFHDKKVVPKLTEGITLTQSLSILYLIYDLSFFEIRNLFWLVLLAIPFLISLYSIIHALTYIPLTNNHKLFLSIWSSIIMIVFAIQHIFSLFNSPSIEQSTISSGMILTIQYFLLGVSSMYILQNFFMLAEYFPSRNRFYDKEHKKDIHLMNRTHIKRYSDEQVKIIDSIFCIIFCLTIYFINFKYQIVHRQTAIWIVFLTFPFILSIKSKLVRYDN